MQPQLQQHFITYLYFTCLIYLDSLHCDQLVNKSIWKIRHKWEKQDDICYDGKCVVSAE
jgi:hypothetical protein